MTRVDTHIIAWIYHGQTKNFSAQVTQLLEETTIAISPIVELELTYLHEIGRLNDNGSTIINNLIERGFEKSENDLNLIISTANTLPWTRDPFDRMITADAIASLDTLITKDKTILENYEKAIW